MHVQLGWLLLLIETYVHFALKFLPSSDPIDPIFYRSQIHLTPHFAVRSDPIGSIFSSRAGHPRQKFSQVPPPGSNATNNERFNAQLIQIQLLFNSLLTGMPDMASLG